MSTFLVKPASGDCLASSPPRVPSTLLEKIQSSTNCMQLSPSAKLLLHDPHLFTYVLWQPLTHFSCQHPKIPSSVTTATVKHKSFMCFLLPPEHIPRSQHLQKDGWWGERPGFHKQSSGHRIVAGLQIGMILSVHYEWSFFGVFDNGAKKASFRNQELRTYYVLCLTTIPHTSRCFWVCPVGIGTRRI